MSGLPWISRIGNAAALRWNPGRDAFRAGVSPEGLLQGARGGVLLASARRRNLNRGQLNPPGGGGAIYDSSRQVLVEELASLASGRGQLLLVPDIVRATVRERAGRLDPAGRALLEVAAVAGLEVEAQLLASVLHEGRPGDLVSAGLLNHEDEERFRFRHPLLQEAAYQEVPAGRRRALHDQIAAVLAKSSSHLTERVAVHLERARRPEAALSVLETAAEEANRAGQVGRRKPSTSATTGSWQHRLRRPGSAWTQPFSGR
jgi:hypothetical protein